MQLLWLRERLSSFLMALVPLGLFSHPLIYTRELKKHNSTLEVKEIACPNWVDIVENGKYKDTSARADIKSRINVMMEFNPEKIIYFTDKRQYVHSF